MAGVAVLAATLTAVAVAGRGTPTSAPAAESRITAADGGQVELAKRIVVELPPGSLAADGLVSIAPTSVDVAHPGAVPVSEAYDVSTHGTALNAPATVRFPVPTGTLPSGVTPSLLFVARLDQGSKSWELMESAVIGDEVTAKVDHFTEVRVFGWLPEKLADFLVEKYVGLLRLIGARAKPPSCEKAPPGVTLTVTPVLFRDQPGARQIAEKDLFDMVLACPDSLGNDAVTTKVVNNRGYSLVLDLPPGSTSTRAPAGNLDEDVARYIGGLFSSQYFLPAGVEGRITIPVTLGGSARVQAKSSQLALAMDAAAHLMELIPATKQIDVLKCVYKNVTAGGDGAASLDKVPGIVKECAEIILDFFGRSAFGIVYKLFEHKLHQLLQSDTAIDKVLGGGEDIVLARAAAKPPTVTTKPPTVTTKPPSSVTTKPQTGTTKPPTVTTQLPTVTTGPPPVRIAAPSNVEAYGLDTSRIQVEWDDNSNNENKFVISSGTSVAVVGANTTSFIAVNLSPDTQVCFTVRAESEVAASDWSPPGCGRTDGEVSLGPPAPPDDMYAELNLGGGDVSHFVEWNDNSDNEEWFEIDNGCPTGYSGCAPGTTLEAEVGADVEFVAFTNLHGTYQCFRVRAVNSAGPSAWSDYGCTQ